MWIAITGAQGSGKSTVARGVAQQLNARGIATVALQGIGAYVSALNFPLGESATSDTIAAFLLEHIKRERHAPPMAVFDRCLVDLVAYAIIQLEPKDPIRHLTIELAQLSIKRFARVFMTPIPPARIDLASPHESGVFRARFESTLASAAALCCTELIKLEGSVDERVERALEAIFKFDPALSEQ